MDNETTIPEPSLEDSIALLLAKVPAPVRDFVLTELQSKTQELMDRYKLHVDQGGLLERELLLMLLGQEEPAEFVTALQEGGIAPETVQNIAKDINNEVFVKLYDKESEEGTSTAASSQPVTPAQTFQVPAAPSAPRVVQPSTPAIPVPDYKPAPPAEPEAVPMPVGPAISQFAPEPAYPTTPAQPVITVTPPISSPLPDVSVSSFPPETSAPDTATAPVSIPVAPPMPRPTPPPVSPNRDALHEVLKGYGVDPYREPPE